VHTRDIRVGIRHDNIGKSTAHVYAYQQHRIPLIL
jgi:hypothetical protein